MKSATENFATVDAIFMDDSKAETNIRIPETFRTMYDLCDFMEMLSGRQERTSETVCYIAPKENRELIMEYLMQHSGVEGGCIKRYGPKGGRIEAVVEGGRQELADALKVFGIARSDIDMY